MKIIVIEDTKDPISKKIHIIDYKGYYDHIPIRLSSLGFDLNKVVEYYKVRSLNINTTEGN